MQSSVSTGRRLVWDLPTRVFHWAQAAAFVGAYLLAEEDGARAFHVMFGYTVAGLLVFRLLWGFIGSQHSRFRDFAYGPAEAVGYVRDLARGRGRDYEGHNPAGGWAVYALLALAAGTAVTGWLTYNEVGGEAFEEVHEALANAWLVMVAVHIGGVIVGSLAHRRNLVATMITGYRPETGIEGTLHARHDDPPPDHIGHPARPGWLLGSGLLAAVLGFWTWSATTGGGPLRAGADGEPAHGERAIERRGEDDHEQEGED